MDNTYSPTLQDLLRKIAPKPSKFDPLGLVSGYKAYRVWQRLNDLDDQQLAALGVSRSEVPRLAAQTIFKD